MPHQKEKRMSKEENAIQCKQSKDVWGWQQNLLAVNFSYSKKYM